LPQCAKIQNVKMTENTPISLQNTGTITISDLRDSYFDELPLAADQILALKEFDKIRVKKLSNVGDDVDFQKQYFDLQVIENTVDYRDFLRQYDNFNGPAG
jgi:hypothetical protein